MPEHVRRSSPAVSLVVLVLLAISFVHGPIEHVAHESNGHPEAEHLCEFCPNGSLGPPILTGASVSFSPALDSEVSGAPHVDLTQALPPALLPSPRAPPL